MSVIYLAIFSLCKQSSNTDRWNSFLNYGLKKDLNDTYIVNVAFKNNAQYPVDIYKSTHNKNTLNPSGMIEKTLNIGETAKFPCIVGDTFTAKINSPSSHYDGMLLMAYDVSRVYIREGECDAETKLLSCNRKPFNGDMRWTPPDSLMFSSFSKDPIDIYFWDGQCEEKVGTISENGDQHIMSTIGHTFRMRNRQNNKLLLEYEYEEIVINSLDENNYEISEKATELFDTLFIKQLKHNIETQQIVLKDLEERMVYKYREHCY